MSVNVSPQRYEVQSQGIQTCEDQLVATSKILVSTRSPLIDSRWVLRWGYQLQQVGRFTEARIRLRYASMNPMLATVYIRSAFFSH